MLFLITVWLTNETSSGKKLHYIKYQMLAEEIENKNHHSFLLYLSTRTTINTNYNDSFQIS